MDLTQMLPDWDFVGGSTQSRTFQLARSASEDYDISDGTAYFAMCEYVNGGAPLVTKQTPVTASANGKYCMATVNLTGADTLELEGCYCYQIMVKDSSGNIAIPFHGRMHIMKNIAPGQSA